MKVISFIQPSRNNLKYLKWSYNSIRKNLGYIHEICWADEAVLKHLIPGTVVSATRIEPPLHPDGPEKILMDYGIEPEEFKESELLSWLTSSPELHHSKLSKETTNGIFAPWAIYKKDFQEINGHDPLYAPQSKEDSDIFNRFVLNGYELVQTWEGFVYHMTCRGSRFKDGALRNPAGQVFMKGRESTEWLEQNLRSTRNFIRKWQHMVKHDELMYPIIPPKYDIGFIVYNCDYNLLKELEPWCSCIYIEDTSVISKYISDEQKNTDFDLKGRVKPYIEGKDNKRDVLVKFDAKQLNASNFQNIVNLSEIIASSGEKGHLELDIFKFNIRSLKTYEKDLILVK